METPPDPGDTKDFRFEKLREFTSWEADKETAVSRVIRGVTVANRFGLAFCICENGFYVINCTDFANLGKNGARLEDSGAFVVRLHGQPVLAAVSSTGLTLAVCFIDNGGLPVAFCYDIRAFSKKDAKVNPFHLIRLSSTPAVTLRDFSWIPTNEEIFAVVLSDGSLSLFEIKENATNVMGSLPPSGATCLSWSPKGKQFAVGRTDGSVAQYKPDLSLARSIPGPKISVSARNIVWLSTYVFAVAYVQPGNSQPILVILNAPKSGEPIFTNFDDVCMGSSDAKREPYYHLLPVFEWNMLLVASNTAMELAVLSCQSVDQTTGWLQLLLEETGRAEMPLVGSEENFPLGVSLLTSTPFPVIITATTLGVLVLYKIVNQMKTPTGMPLNICSKVELLGSIPGERRQLDIPQPQQRPPVITQATSVPEKKPIFAHPNLSESFSSVKSPLTLSTNQAAKPTLPSPVQPSVPLFGSTSLGSLLDENPKADKPSLAPSKEPVHTARPVSPKHSLNLQHEKEQTVSTTIISSKGMTAAHTTTKPVAGPAKIPSGTVQQFLRNISALGKQIEGLSIEREPHKDAELSLHMENLSAAMDSLMSMFNETAIRLNEQEGLLEARLHVVEEALVIIEKCSDSHFLACFRDLPLDPLQQRKYNKLQSNLKEIETKLRSISMGIDFELDTMEAAAVNTEDQFADAKKTIKTIEVAALELQRKLFEIEKEAKKAGLHRRSVRPEVQVSPAEAISRLYPDLTKMASTKLSPAVSLRIRNNIRNSQPRTTKHEVILLRRHVAQEKTSSPTPKPSAKSSFKLDADFSGFNTQAAGDGSSKPIKTEAKNVGASMKTADQTFPEIPEQAVPSAVFSGSSFTFGVDKSVGATKPAAATKTSEPKPSANREIETLKSTFGGTPSFGFGAHTSSNVAKTEPPTKSTDQKPLSSGRENASTDSTSRTASSFTFGTPSSVAAKHVSVPVGKSDGSNPSTGFGSLFGGGSVASTVPAPTSGGSAAKIPEPAKPLSDSSASQPTGFGNFKTDSSPFGSAFGSKPSTMTTPTGDSPAAIFGAPTFGQMPASSAKAGGFASSASFGASSKAATGDTSKAAADLSSPGLSFGSAPALSGQLTSGFGAQMPPKTPAKSQSNMESDVSKVSVQTAGKSIAAPVKTEAKEIDVSVKAPDQPVVASQENTAPRSLFGGSSFGLGTDSSLSGAKFGAAAKAPEQQPSVSTIPKTTTPSSTVGSASLFGFGANTSLGSAKFGSAEQQPLVANNPANVSSAAPMGGASSFGLGTDFSSATMKPASGPKIMEQKTLSSSSQENVTALNLSLGGASFGFGTASPAATKPASGTSTIATGATSTGFGSSFGGGTMTFGFPPPSSASPATTIPEPAKPLWPNAGSAAPSTGFTSFKVDTPAFGGGTVSSSSNPFATQAASSGFPTTGSGFGNFSSFGSKPASGTAGTAAPSGGFGSPFGGGTVTSTFPASNFPAATAAEPAKPMWGSTTTATQPSGFTSFKVDTPSFGGGGFGAPSNPFATQAAASGFPSAGFGASAFGQTPAFGGASGGFGASPSFGSSVQAPSGSAIWNTPGGFAAYASTPGLSFGSVAAQNNQPSGGFGAVTQQQPQQSGGFGFGGGNTGGAPQSNAFTQYR